MPQALAAFTGTNSTGVRNPYAVLAARLSPRRAAPRGTVASGPAAVLRRMRRAHADARLRWRHAMPVPALQAETRHEHRSSSRGSPSGQSRTPSAGITGVRLLPGDQDEGTEGDAGEQVQCGWWYAHAAVADGMAEY
jgi:hypothetical protein